MENAQIFLGLSVVILTGLMFIAGFKYAKKDKNKIADLAIAEIRRVLWEKGSEATNFRTLNWIEALQHFGWRAIPHAAYQDNYFVEVTASEEVAKKHIVRIVLAFDKEVIETEWK